MFQLVARFQSNFRRFVHQFLHQKSRRVVPRGPRIFLSPRVVVDFPDLVVVHEHRRVVAKRHFLLVVFLRVGGGGGVPFFFFVVHVFFVFPERIIEVVK